MLSKRVAGARQELLQQVRNTKPAEPFLSLPNHNIIIDKSSECSPQRNSEDNHVKENVTKQETIRKINYSELAYELCELKEQGKTQEMINLFSNDIYYEKKDEQREPIAKEYVLKTALQLLKGLNNKVDYEGKKF